MCFWREQADTEWKCGAVKALPKGVEDDKYYEVAVDLEAARHVYALRPLTQSVVSSLNPDVDLAGLEEDIAQIGYPLRG
ncbi:hypothetical protein ACWCXB_34100 [Streptomyces sp. NPDC001514]